MKKQKHIACIMLAAMLAVACSKDDHTPEPDPDPIPPTDGRVEMTFTATMAPATRTSLGEGSEGVYPVLWNDGDEIVVMPIRKDCNEEGMTDKMKFTASIAEGTAATATFTGFTYPDDSGYVAFYPHGGMVEYFFSYALFMTIPTDQSAVAGGFAPGAYPACAVAGADEGTLEFRPVCGLVRFSLSGDAVAELESVRFDAGRAVLTGTLGYSQDGGFTGDDISPVSWVSLTGGFEAAADYYMVTAPCSLSEGYSLTFTRKDGSVCVKEGKIEGAAVSAGTICDMGGITLSDADFGMPSEDDITDMAFVRAVEESAGITLERNEAGYVSLTEGNLKAMASVTELDISGMGLRDASVLRHFTGLTSLDCSSNDLTTLDVGMMTGLGNLNCCYNRISELNVQGATALGTLYCYNNELTELDVSGLENLFYLDCCTNRLEELNTSGTPMLMVINCGGNRLSSLDVSGSVNLSNLKCYDNRLTELKMGVLPRLFSVECQNNRLSSLDVSGLESLSNLYCQNNQLTALDVGGLPWMSYLTCYGNRLSGLDISMIPDLYEVYCGLQTSDGTEPQTLTLTLTAAQRDGAWATSIENDAEHNGAVELNVLEE